jgi:D-inositol-3-phosphate glycosyltransferase
MLSVHTCPLAVLGGKETGGMNVYVREIARELGRMGVEVDVFTRSQNPNIRRVVALGERANVVHLPAGREAPMPRERVHDHLDEFVDGIETWRLTRGAEYDLVHAHYWLSGVAACALAERWGVPVVQMFHTLGRLKNHAARTPGEQEPGLRIAEETRIAASVDRIVAANAVERAQLIQEYRAPAARIAVIPCGVDTDLFAPGAAEDARAALGLDPGPVVLYAGRIAPIKGLDTLLDAIERLRERACPVRLLVIGGDADEVQNGHEAELRDRAARAGLDGAVTFIGAQSQERLRTYYRAADVVVMPSYYESFGMVALEAMACGRPVIASRVGGLPITVRDGVTGYLVPEGDVARLAERIDVLLGDPDLRGRLGFEGVRWAAQHRWPCVAEAICREYAALQPTAESYLAAGRCRG